MIWLIRAILSAVALCLIGTMILLFEIGFGIRWLVIWLKFGGDAAAVDKEIWRRS